MSNPFPLICNIADVVVLHQKSREPCWVTNSTRGQVGLLPTSETHPGPPWVGVLEPQDMNFTPSLCRGRGSRFLRDSYEAVNMSSAAYLS